MNIKRYLDRNALLLVTALAIAAGTTMLVSYAPAVSPATSVAARFWSVVSANIFVAIVSTFAAAFAGTWGAQVLAERNARRKTLLEEIRGTNSATPLIQSITGLDDTFRQRNDWIREFRQLPLDADEHKANLYFGLRSPRGHTDERYPGYIKAIENQTDDCIAFAFLLGTALIKSGQKLTLAYGKGSPKIAEPDFKKGEPFMPDMNQYNDWIK